MNAFRLHVFTFLFLAPTVLVGQTQSHYVQFNFNSYGGDLYRIGDNSVGLIGVGYHDVLFGASALYRATFSLSGNIGEQEVLDYHWGEDPTGYATMPLADGSLIVLSNIHGCDYDQPLVVSRYDAAQNQVWVTEPPGTYFHLPDTRLWLLEDSIITITAGQSQNHLRMGGMHFDTTDLPLFDLQMFLTDGILVSSGNVFMKLDPSFLITDSIVFASPVRAFDTLSSGGFAVLSDVLVVLDEDLVIEDSTDVEGDFRWLAATSRGYFLFDDVGEVAHLSVNLELDTTYTLGFPGSVYDILHVGDTIFIAGTHDNGHNTGLFCIRTQADAFLEARAPDLTLVEISISDTVRYSRVDWGAPLNTYAIDYGPVYLKLANTGTVPITHAYAKFSQRFCPGICAGYYQDKWLLDNLDLMPGEVKTVHLGDLSYNCAFFSPGTFCLAISGPNDQPDADGTNDYRCADIDLIISSIDDHDADSFVFTIWPNPASSEVTIRCSDRAAMRHDVYIYDSFGRLKDRIVFSGKEVEIPVKGYPPGMYYFTIQSEHTPTVVRKVIVTP